MSLLLGIDNGGTTSKAALFDCEGREIAAAAYAVRWSEPHPGWSERDPEEMWRATAGAIRGVLRESAIDPSAIRAVACAGHGNGLYLVDGRGAPVRPAINSNDRRAQIIVDSWEADGTAAEARRKTTQSLWPGQPNALLRWLAEHDPETLARSTHLLFCKDFIRLRLTGAVHTDVSDISGSSLWNVVEGRYDDDLLKSFGLLECRRLLPPVLPSAAPAGEVTRGAAELTGLRPGTPVFAGMFDIDACGLGCGMVDARRMTAAIGTWGNCLAVAREAPAAGDLFMCSRYSVPGSFLLLEGSATSAGNLDWVLERLGIESPEAASEAVAGQPPDPAGPLFLPFLYGSHAGTQASGCFLGLEHRHGTPDLLRAAYEGVVLAFQWHHDRLLPYSGRPETIRFSGGAARSAVWMQMFADALESAVETPRCSELGALGAAVAAGVGADLFDSYEAAVDSMAHASSRFDPRSRIPEYWRVKQRRYRDAIRRLAGFWS